VRVPTTLRRSLRLRSQGAAHRSRPAAISR
jgi:hypothetical protein